MPEPPLIQALCGSVLELRSSASASAEQRRAPHSSKRRACVLSRLYQDHALRQAVNRFGGEKWKSIAAIVGTRDSTQCRQRWNKALKPAAL